MTQQNQTIEPQYQILYDVLEKHGRAQFGLMANESWNQDPKRTLFTLARYKFVAKMLHNKSRVLEVGCADAFGTRLVQQAVKEVTAIDFDPIFIQDIEERKNPSWPLTSFVHNMLSGPIRNDFEGVFCLDVLEHISKDSEDIFLNNCRNSMSENGVMIVGIPSRESQAYASPQSKAGHVNCKSGEEFKGIMEKYFHNVFMFSMNDEIVHTGFFPMAHYLFAMCCTKRV
jgi:2-polyprenyl-3-methyl-5-hydroxy-6-metoxy-1,4-benzoquinol methylase